MRRVHLLEFHDQPWFPAFLRDHVTDALQFLLNLARVDLPIVPRFRRTLQEAGSRRILDLCSGAGGPWPWLSENLQRDGSLAFDVLLTDKYPHSPASQPALPPRARIRFHHEPVDATQVPAELRGFRTLFNSFHHFPPPQARGILQDAVAQQQGIGIFEAPGRYAITIFLICLMPLGYLLVAPFQRPFRWSRLFWTYLLPVIPLVLFFDGIVSCLRIYSPPELQQLVSTLPANRYEWEIGVERGGSLRVPVTYLIGRPPSGESLEKQNQPRAAVLP